MHEHLGKDHAVYPRRWPRVNTKRHQWLAPNIFLFHFGRAWRGSFQP